MPETRYAKNGDVHLAYQVTGGGPVDLVDLGPWAGHLELDWEFPANAALLHRLGSFGRLIRMNRRGVGLSDRRLLPGSLDEEVGDILAVLDATTSYRPFLLGSMEGAARAVLTAARHPGRVAGLILYGGYAKAQPTDDFDAPPAGLIEALSNSVETGWGRGWATQLIVPGADATLVEWMTRFERMSLGPGDAAALMRTSAAVDVRDALPSITAPTLVLHRRDDPLVPFAQGRYLAEHIPGARFVELEGSAHPMYSGDVDRVVAEIAEFVTGTRPSSPSARALVTVLFTDVVGSTDHVADLGDAQWAQRRSELERLTGTIVAELGGRIVKWMGDGMLATFDAPARAVRAAVATSVAGRSLGLELRAGLHTGEVELSGEDLHGIAVNMGARVCADAGAGEVVVTSTVRDLIAGSGVELEDLGPRSLKGVPEEWRLYRVVHA